MQNTADGSLFEVCAYTPYVLKLLAGGDVLKLAISIKNDRDVDTIINSALNDLKDT
jgi:hypothetical protein